MVSSLLLALVIQGYTVPAPGSVERTAVLDALRAKTQRALRGQKVVFKVNVMRQAGDWIFFKGKGLQPNGEAIDYKKTVYADDVKEGMFDDWVCALFKRQNGKWVVKTYVWGATDVPYEGWPKEFGAPRVVFDLPDSP